LEVREEVRQLAEPLAEDSGFEVVDVEQVFLGRHRVIRVLLDKPGGITVGDCARFSRRLSDCLDMNQTVTGSYQLEVSSPGLDRPLRSLRDFERAVGQLAKVHLARPTADGQRVLRGTIAAAADGAVEMSVDGKNIRAPFEDVERAHLIFELPTHPKGWRPKPGKQEKH